MPSVGERVDPMEFYARAAVLVVIVGWGVYFWTLPLEPLFHTHIEGSPGYSAIGESFLHWVNLVFHEAGHILLMPFGRTLMIAGGSIMQILMPWICMMVLLFKQRDPFGASVGMWWMGQSTLDVAPYIYDADRRVLTLLGKGNGRELVGSDGRTPHDWYNLLTHYGQLHQAEQLAELVWFAGVGIMAVAMVWGAACLRRQWPQVYNLGDR
ncbi:MAG: hypothetical protein AAGI01_04610 [Myxococcota bacterium]